MTATNMGDLNIQTGDLTVEAEDGVTVVGPLTKLEETVTYDSFTDGGSTVGTYNIAVGTIPAGAIVIGAALTAVTGFAGDTSATIQVGDGTDVDRYSTGTPSVFATSAAGLSLGDISGVAYHADEKTVTVTVTTNADFTSVSAGSITLELFYLS